MMIMETIYELAYEIAYLPDLVGEILAELIWGDDDIWTVINRERAYLRALGWLVLALVLLPVAIKGGRRVAWGDLARVAWRVGCHYAELAVAWWLVNWIWVKATGFTVAKFFITGAYLTGE
jgi:hypothetical protein